MDRLILARGPPLSQFVEILWYYKNDPQAHAKERLMPDGCISLILIRAEYQNRIYNPVDTHKVRKFRDIVVSGPQSKSFAIDTDEQQCVIGVSFRPAGAVPFLKLPSDQLRNLHLDLEDPWAVFRANFASVSSPLPRPQENSAPLNLLSFSARPAPSTRTLPSNTPSLIFWLLLRPRASTRSPRKPVIAPVALSNCSSNALA